MHPRLIGQLIVLSLVTMAFFLLHLEWFPAYRDWQHRQQLGQDLELAVLQERPDQVQRLLDAGADVRTTEQGRYVAFNARCPKTLAIFLNRGFDVNASTYADDTLLAQAASDGNLPMVRFILQRGADIHRQGSFALAAAKSGMESAVEYAGVTRPPDTSSEGGDPKIDEARAAQPFLDVIAALKRAGAHEQPK